MRLRPDSALFVFFLSALGGITPLSVDMNLPALADIGHSLHVPPSSAGLTLSVFLAGFAFGPVLLGPMSDRFGRRPVLLGGLVVFVVGSIGCAVAGSLPALLAWRLAQGIGAGAGATISLAIVRDLFDGAPARVLLSYMSTVGSAAPMIAPTLGGIVLWLSDWRTIYTSLATAGFLLTLVVLVAFRESHPEVNPAALELRPFIRNYGRVYRHRLVAGLIAVSSLTFACMFTYVASSPLVMFNVLGVSQFAYGFTFAATALGIMGGAFMNGRLSARGVAPDTLLVAALVVSFAAAAALLAVTYTSLASVATVLPLLVLNTFCFGIVMPNTMQGAMHPMPDIAGVVSAAIGSTRMIVGASVGAWASYLFNGHDAHAMAWLMALSTAAALAVYFAVVHRAELEIDRSAVETGR